MSTPTAPLPSVAETWIARSKYLRWLDALTALLVLFGVVAVMLHEHPTQAVVLLSLVLLVIGIMLPSVRFRWRPISGWVGVTVSRRLRPGARAWFVRDGRADAVLVTARRGLRMSIALPGFGEAETIRVRRTRVLLVPLV